MRDALGKVSQGAALHVDEGFFPGNMHNLQYELSGIAINQMKIVVVLSGQRARRSFESILFESDSGSFRCRNGRCHAGFRHHAQNSNSPATVRQIKQSRGLDRSRLPSLNLK